MRQTRYEWVYLYAAVEPANPAYQVFGQVFASGPGQPVDMNAHVRSYYRISNNGGGSTGSILIATTCNYSNGRSHSALDASPRP